MEDKKAFTLAEVLITLTIIGVIAVLTIPNLMQSYKKHLVETKVKEAYSMLNQMFTIGLREQNLSYSELNVIIKQQNGFNFLADNFLKSYLRISKDCSKTSSGICSKVLNVKNIYNTSSIDFQPTDYKYILNNGMYVGFSFWWNYNLAFVFVDIDGAKGQSVSGKDVFIFTLNSNGFGNSFSSCGPLYINGYSVGYAGYGFGCTRILMNNNWKIPDNYPVKKF